MFGAVGKPVSLVAMALVPMAFVAATPASVSADGISACSGGSVTAGTYSSLAIAGVCYVDAGNVNVQSNLIVMPGAKLVAAFAGSDLSVRGNLSVQSGAMLILGCEPFAFPCLNDPNAATGGTLSGPASVGGNLAADGALAVLVHNTSVGRNLALTGGGGGVACIPDAFLSSLAHFPLPPYAAFEDVGIGGNAAITGWRSCWLGFFRNDVTGNVNFNNNVVADPDGNEVATNTIQGNLNCSGDTPNPQIGDSGGSFNTVSGRANGQCASLV